MILINHDSSFFCLEISREASLFALYREMSGKIIIKKYPS